MRECIEKTFVSHDGVELFYRHWPAANAKTDAPAIMLFHRGHEHSGRVAHIPDEIDMPDYQFFAWDARGAGMSPGERGDAPSLAWMVKDAQSFFEHIKTSTGLADNNIAVMAQSVGAVLAATWVHDYVPKIRAMVLASPAFKVKLYVPFAIPGLRLMYNVRGNFFVNSYVKAKLLSHDPTRVESYDSDPLIARPISTRILLDLFDTSKRIVADAAAIDVPTQLLVSGKDYVVSAKPQQNFYRNLGTNNKAYHVYDGFFHDTLGEKDRYLPLGDAKRFLETQFAKTPQYTDLLNADKGGYTKQEADNIGKAATGFKKWYWAYQRANLRYAAKLSDGVKLGMKTGFDSGSTLDYVYRNQASGETTFGRFADYVYLQAIGWRGIRERKVHLEALLKTAIAKLQDEGKPVHVVDVAAGHGRYVLEAATQVAKQPDSILLRDYSDINVAAGQNLIVQKGLSHIAQFEKGDAFSFDELSNLKTKPTLGIVSGLYELFADNTMVSTSLKGLAAGMADDAILLYTGQPWHPQVEYIARVLTSHREGQAWVMRRRTQNEMDQLVADAGFEKVDMLVDQWGIFTVSMARKKAS